MYKLHLGEIHALALTHFHFRYRSQKRSCILGALN